MQPPQGRELVLVKAQKQRTYKFQAEDVDGLGDVQMEMWPDGALMINMPENKIGGHVILSEASVERLVKFLERRNT